MIYKQWVYDLYSNGGYFKFTESKINFTENETVLDLTQGRKPNTLLGMVEYLRLKYQNLTRKGS